jgi:hypothetical protein
MLYREIIAVCSEIHTKGINTLLLKNITFLYFKSGGTYRNHWIFCIIKYFLIVYRNAVIEIWKLCKNYGNL